MRRVGVTNRSVPFSLGVIAVVAAAVLWGATGTIQALLPEAREPVVVAAMRIIIGAVALLCLALAVKRDRDGLWRVPAMIVLPAGFAIAAYNATFFAAVADIGVGVGTALAVGSAPLWATAFEALFLRRRPTSLQLVGQAIAIAGASLLVASSGAVTMSASGVAMALAAGASYAGYSIVTGRARADVSSTALAAATFGVAGLMIAPALALLPTAWVFEPRALALLAVLGVASTGLAYVLYTWGLKSVAASTAVTLALAEPLTAWVLATILLGEALTGVKFVGAALLLTGLWLVTRPARTGGQMPASA